MFHFRATRRQTNKVFSPLAFKALPNPDGSSSSILAEEKIHFDVGHSSKIPAKDPQRRLRFTFSPLAKKKVSDTEEETLLLLVHGRTRTTTTTAASSRIQHDDSDPRRVCLPSLLLQISCCRSNSTEEVFRVTRALHPMSQGFLVRLSGHILANISIKLHLQTLGNSVQEGSLISSFMWLCYWHAMQHFLT